MFVDLGGPSRRAYSSAPSRPGTLTAAEQAAFEIASISLAQARELVELYAEKGDPKVRAGGARDTWTRYIAEGSPLWLMSPRPPRPSRSSGLLDAGLETPGALPDARVVTPRRADPADEGAA